MFDELTDRYIVKVVNTILVTVCTLFQKLHETWKLQKTNEKLEFLSQQITSIHFLSNIKNEKRYSYLINFGA